MSINPQTYEGVAYGLSEAGAQVTYGVAEALTELHKAVIEDPDNLSRAADIYAQHVAKACAKWEKDWRKWADEGLLEAYIQGVKHTDAELANLRKAGIRVHPPTEPIPEGAVMVKNLPTMTLPLDSPRWMKEAFVEIPNHLTAFNVFRRAAYFALEGTALQIIRKGNDLYRDVAIQAGSQMFREADIFTRRQFSQRMLDDFAQRGIQAITYSNGRKMSIEAYAEMVGRTMSGHAAVQGSLNRYAEHGYDLVRVSAHFRACELCVPYEGRILSLDGRDPNYESLDSAISQGLFHPNCAHDVSPYIPGLSPDLEVRVSKEEQALIDQYGYKKAQEIAYKAQVQQRYIERQIRFWKKRELTSLDDVAKAKAHRKVLDWQKTQREHLKVNAFLSRKYEREAVRNLGVSTSSPITPPIPLTPPIPSPIPPPATPPISTTPLWEQGKIIGASKEQENLIRETLGKVPKRLLPNDLTIEVLPNTKMRGLFGVFKDGKIRLNRTYLKPSAKLSAAQIQFDILHEVGHMVMERARFARKYNYPVRLTLEEIKQARQDFLSVSDYALGKHAGEAFAEGFAYRIIHGKSPGSLAEAIWKKVGI